jgi:hypothetical protein
MAPQLALTYSSESTNERHDGRAPAGPVGEGWSLGMGSISVEHVASGSTTGTDWYFLSGVNGVSDRLIPDKNHAGFYLTEHLSHLRVQKNATCFRVWDRSGSYSEYGCTADSRQTTVTGGSTTTYRYDLSKMYLPYADPTAIRALFVSYIQDWNGDGRVEEAVLKQITYGTVNAFSDTTPDVVAGVVDFTYRGPSVPPGADGFVTAYGYHTCSDEAGNLLTSSGTPIQINVRCDIPQWVDTSTPNSSVLSNMTLDRVTSYVGNKSSVAYTYTLTHTDFFSAEDCTVFLIGVSARTCAGDHLLTRIEAMASQNGTAHKTGEVNYTYQTATDTYYDPQPAGGSTPYQEQTTWKYLSEYRDRFTNGGSHITYETAANNMHGTPTTTLADGTIDTARNALYCWRHRTDSTASARCEGVYAHPDELS